MSRGGTTQSFTYDAQGRLDTMFVDAGEQLVDFGYDSAAGVSV